MIGEASSEQLASIELGLRGQLLGAFAAEPSLLHRWVVSILLEEVARLTGRAASAIPWQSWTRDTRIDEAGIGLDSLARLEVVARLNEAFDLASTAIEDYVFIAPSLGEWCDLILKSFEIREHADDIWLGFRTSGSDGVPKRVRHRLDALLAEASIMGGVLRQPRRVNVSVPLHHIYGCLFGVLLPALLGSDVRDAKGNGPSCLLADTDCRTLCVATPFHWALAMRSAFGRQAATGLSSTAPAPPSLWASSARHLSRMVEVFGSTETAGIGWRENGDAPFALMENLRRDVDTVLDSRGQALELQDRLRWQGERHFQPEGRRDGAVQVGGVNVFPDKVARVLSAVPSVRASAVRLGSGGRLKAFIVPEKNVKPEALEVQVRARLLETLTPPERPTEFRFGAEIPTNDMGKATDWT
ncbi:MAG: 4-coumarate--CoA ligase [Pseudomonadota bacterium]